MKSAFQLVVLPGENPSESIRPYYERAYAHWEKIWSATFKELDGKGILFSDNFTRQDEVICVFDGLLCVAMVCHRYVDLSLTSAVKDSYFEKWPEEALSGLTAHGHRILIGNQISVDPERRGRTADDISLKDLVSALSMWRLSQLDVDALPGTMRADRNMQNFLINGGATPLLRNVLFHNVPVDLVAFHPKVRPVTLPAATLKLVESLWKDHKGDAPLDYLLLNKTKTRTA